MIEGVSVSATTSTTFSGFAGLPLTGGNHFTRDFPRRVVERWLVGLGCKVIKGVFRIRSGQLRQRRRGGRLHREICVRLNQDLWARLITRRGAAFKGNSVSTSIGSVGGDSQFRICRRLD